MITTQELFIMCELDFRLAQCNGPIKTGQVRHIAVMQRGKMLMEIMKLEV